MCDPVTLASHEIGHFLMLVHYGFKAKQIDITNTSKPHIIPDYGKFDNLARQLGSKKQLNNLSSKEWEFAKKYIHILYAGDICEELYRHKFKTKQLSLFLHTSDTDIIKFHLDQWGAISHEEKIVSSVSKILMNHWFCASKYTRLLLKGLLCNEPEMSEAAQNALFSHLSNQNGQCLWAGNFLRFLYFP
jgi:hypothetical protein